MYSTLANVQDLVELKDNDTTVIVDCRYDLSDEKAGYRKYLSSHIPGAVYADLKFDLSGPPVTDHGRHPMPVQEKMITVFSGLGISNSSQVVLYDDSYGAVAARLWWMLRYMGHKKAAVLDGGWPAWLAAGLLKESGERKNKPGKFSGVPATGALVLLGQVMDAGLLVDSREPERYTGEIEPIDPVPGHIPAAVNYHWRKNIGDNGLFLSSHELRKQLLKVFNDTAPEGVVFYCGSGVTACHNLLAAAHAGLEGSRLYAGSWSEWCREPGFPVATGVD